MTAIRYLGFVLSRLVQPFAVLWVLYSLLFVIETFADPSAALGSIPDANARERLLEQLGLTGSPVERYVGLLRRGLTVDFGNSILTRRPALDAITPQVGSSLGLLGAASLAAAVLGFPLALLAATVRRRPWSVFPRWLVAVFSSLPAYVVVVVLLWVLAIQLKLVPTFGTGTPQHFVIPSIALAITMIPTVVRAGRAARGAWSTGQSGLFRVFRSIAAWVNPFAVDFGLILSALILVENLVNWPGVGRILVQATLQRDLPVVLTFVAIVAWCAVLFDFLNTVLMGVADPRASQVAINAAEYGPTRDDLAVGRISWWRVLATLPGLLLLFLVVITAFGSFVPPKDPVQQTLTRRLEAPGPGSILGTDQLGRDVFSRLLVATRDTVLFGIAVALGALLLGGLIGEEIGVFARSGLGWLAAPLIGYARAVRSLPALVWLLLATAFFGPGLYPIGITMVLILAVPAAGLVSDLIVIGSPEAWSAVPKDSVPSTDARVITVAGGWCLLTSGAIIMFEAANLLGIGVLPPEPTLGATISSGLPMLDTAAWIAIPSALALVVCLFAFTLIADTLADVTSLKRIA